MYPGSVNNPISPVMRTSRPHSSAVSRRTDGTTKAAVGAFDVVVVYPPDGREHALLSVPRALDAVHPPALPLAGEHGPSPAGEGRVRNPAAGSAPPASPSPGESEAIRPWRRKCAALLLFGECLAQPRFLLVRQVGRDQRGPGRPELIQHLVGDFVRRHDEQRRRTGGDV